MQTLLILAVLSFSMNSWASEESHPPAIISRIHFSNYLEREVKTQDGVLLKFIEVTDIEGQVHDGAPGILLEHGFTCNINGWLYTPEELVKLGFRVFVGNWRGHGQGSNRSIVAGEKFDGQDSRYSFENAAVYDAPTMVREVRRLTGHKVLYVGHSMGGMIMHLALAGLTKNSAGELIVSQVAAKKLAADVAAFIPVGSPLNIEDENDGLKNNKRAFLNFLLTQYGLPLDHSRRVSEWYLPLSIAEYAFLQTMYNLGSLRHSGVLEMRNLTFGEFLDLAIYAGSDVPAAFMQSLRDVVMNNYGSNGIDFNALSMRRTGSPTVVPTHLVSADMDTLAPLDQQILLAKEPGVRQTIMKNTGHVDMIAARSRADQLIKVIVEMALKHFPRRAIPKTLRSNCDTLLAE